MGFYPFRGPDAPFTLLLAYYAAEGLLLPNRQGKGNPPLASRFDADFVVHGASELLLAAEVNFRSLDGYMIKEKLDLVRLTSGKMAQTRTRASQLVGRKLIDSGSLRGIPYDLPKYFRRHALAPDLSRLVECSKKTAVLDSYRRLRLFEIG